jgi:hypothetical protein
MAGISDIIGNIKNFFQERKEAESKPVMKPEDEGKTFGQGEFYYDDPNLIRFIQQKADQNGTSYQEELMKYEEEVEGFYKDKNKNVDTFNPNDYKESYLMLMQNREPNVPRETQEQEFFNFFNVDPNSEEYNNNKNRLLKLLSNMPDGGKFIDKKANGGIASIRDFTAGGGVSGPGTGTSDSIPAMLSDGEFVMTADAVKGFGGGSRKQGAQKLYAMMEKAENSARNKRRS